MLILLVGSAFVPLNQKVALIRRAKPNNMALQMKLLWKLVKGHPSLWVELVKKIYCRKSVVLSHKVSIGASWQWKNLMRLRPVFSRGLCWHVGNGRSIHFWQDNWVFPYPISSIIQVPSDSLNLRVADVMAIGSSWNRAKLLELVPIR